MATPHGSAAELAEAIAKIDDLLRSGEVTRRLEASQADFDRAVAALRQAEEFELSKLRQTINI